MVSNYLILALEIFGILLTVIVQLKQLSDLQTLLPVLNVQRLKVDNSRKTQL